MPSAESKLALVPVPGALPATPLPANVDTASDAIFTARKTLLSASATNMIPLTSTRLDAKGENVAAVPTPFVSAPDDVAPASVVTTPPATRRSSVPSVGGGPGLGVPSPSST